MTSSIQPIMLRVEDALERILATCPVLNAETVFLANACDRVLAEHIIAECSLPHFPNAAMDGFAARYEDLVDAHHDAPVVLRVIGESVAGRGFADDVKPGTAVRIMTGAPLPAGADVVVCFEDTTSDGDTVRFTHAPRSRGHHIRHVGEDVQAGQRVLSAGSVLRPQDIGLLAALGYAQVQVVRQPRIAIICTGDELVPIEASLEPGNVRNVNDVMLAAAIKRAGGIAYCQGIVADTASALEDSIATALAHHVDVLVTTAGVSVGDYDMVKTVLMRLGTLSFWRVCMKPGKPLVSGFLQGVPMIGLPGNPTAVFTAAEVFIRPVVWKMSGRRVIDPPQVYAILDEHVRGIERRHYVPARLYHTHEGHRVTTQHGTGSGAHALSTLVWANALLPVPEQSSGFQAGERVAVLPLD